MVTSETETRNRPEYSLDRIHALARQGKVGHASRRVQWDVGNLGYAPEDVHRCLQSLRTCNFKHSERYGGSGHWLDVYHLVCTGPCDVADDLYVKLKLNRDCVVVILHSFHRDR